MQIFVFGMAEHAADAVALVNGYKAVSTDAALVRVHSACLTGDLFGSLKCDCGQQLTASIQAIARAPWGVLVYLTADEGRGIGLVNKIRAYALQDDGLDTVKANTALRLPVDDRHYTTAVDVLAHLGVARAWLITNNPDKVSALRASGITVEGTMPVPPRINVFNQSYLNVKRDMFGHRLRDDSCWAHYTDAG